MKVLFWTLAIAPLFCVVTSVSSKVYFEAAFQGRCGDASPCAHLCYNLHDGTYECDCREGFFLDADGYTCLQIVEGDEFLDEDESNATKVATQSPKEAHGGRAILQSNEASNGEENAKDITDRFEGRMWNVIVANNDLGDLDYLGKDRDALIDRFYKPGTSSEESTGSNTNTDDPTSLGPRLEQKLPTASSISLDTTESIPKNLPSIQCDCGAGQCDPSTGLCKCPLGTYGTGCNKELTIHNPSFSGDSWAEFPILHSASEDLAIDVDLLPSSWDGVVFYSGEGVTNGDFFGVTLRDGYIEVRMDCGSGMGVVRSSFPVRLNAWNKLRIRRHEREIVLTLNKDLPITGRSEGLFTRITFREPVFIGGSPNISAIIPITGVKAGFSGCLQGMKINHEHYKFLPQPHGDARFGWNIDECHGRLCRTKNCLNNGQCLASANDESATCVCPLGYSGERCQLPLQIEVPMFNGSSHLKYPGLGSTSLLTLDLKIRFKPDKLDGVIVFNGNGGGRKDFFGMKLQDGYIIFSIDFGGGVTSLRSLHSVSPHEWHTVVVHRSGRGMELTVDDQVSVATVAIGSFSQLTLSGPLFLGGVSREEEGDIAEEIFNEEGFIGCVQEFVVNSKPVSMISAAFSGINVLNCPHPCSDRPCWNGGICQPTGEEFNCACPLGFRPSDCREKVPLDDTVPMFLGNGYLHYSDPQVTELLSGRETYFRVRFRTWRNGLILWVGQQENTLNSQFASLSVESGLVTFRYNLGHGDLVLIGNSSVIQNGEWHIVEAIRSDQSASIRVDDGPVVIKTSASQVQSLNPNSGLYLGGAENVELQTQGRFREGFLGCVSEVNLDPSYSVYLMSQADRGQNVDTCS